MSSEFPTLARYESLMVLVTMLLVGALAYKAWKDSGMVLNIGKEGVSGSTLGQLHGSVLSHTGANEYREGYEAPAFWNAGSMHAIAEAQAKGISVEQLDNQAEGMRGYVSREGVAVINGQVVNPY
jgi:hypothetical protein